MYLDKTDAKPPGKRLIANMPIRTKWLILAPLGLVLIGYGLCVFSEAGHLKHTGSRAWKRNYRAASATSGRVSGKEKALPNPIDRASSVRVSSLNSPFGLFFRILGRKFGFDGFNVHVLDVRLTEQILDHG